MKTSIFIVAQKISERISNNFIFLMLYYSVAVTLVMFGLDSLFGVLGIGTHWTPNRLVHFLGLGISLGVFHRFILQRKGLSLARRVSMGTLLAIFLGIAFSLLSKWI